MENPYQIPKSSIHEQAPANSRAYRNTNIVYALIAASVFFGAARGGSVDLTLPTFIVSFYLFLPCVTAACLCWSSKGTQAVAMRCHLYALSGLFVYGVYMTATGHPPPFHVLMFSCWSLFMLAWSYRKYREEATRLTAKTRPSQ